MQFHIIQDLIGLHDIIEILLYIKKGYSQPVLSCF